MKNYILLTLLFFLFSCRYSPNGTNFVESETSIQPIQFDAQISPTFVIDDTTKVYDGIEISYSIDLDNKLLRGINYWLDDDTLSDWADYDDYSYQHGPISMNTNMESNGPHVLHFEFTTSSGRENVADLLGAETILYRDSIEFVIDNGPATPVPITDIENVNGEIVISWKKYRRPLFDEYRVQKEIESNGTFITNIVPDGVIEDRFVESITDKSYIGGTVRYKVMVNYFNQYATGSEVEYNDTYPQIENVEVKGNELFIKWNKCKYPSNFSNYEIQADRQYQSRRFYIENIKYYLLI
ncbi:hypothetical protein [Gracilimonas tropica]|uniref:hypothetical protein n=1 Tax=Gracilimonas tropica TaxID=454600 RepID=UPI00037B4BCE|nr:hypothetical protein [Gracilimonas tropica]